MPPDPHQQPGGIRSVLWQSDETTPLSSEGEQCLSQTALAIVSPAVPASVLEHIPDTTPAVLLPTAASPKGENPTKTAGRMAKEVVRQGQLVAGIHTSRENGRPHKAIPAAATGEPGLAGAWILVTRPRRQSIETVEHLRSLGASVISLPAIVIAPPSNWDPVDAAIDRIEEYDWLVFSSTNGVQFLLDRLLERHGDAQRLSGVKLAAIGPTTADLLSPYGLEADLVPSEYRAEALAEALAEQAAGKKFLLARASRGREILAERLTAAGADVHQVVVYRSDDLPANEARLHPLSVLLNAGQIDWVTVTSSAIARSLAGLFGASLKKTRLASISPLTSAALQELGYPPSVEAKTYTMEGLVEAMQAEPKTG